MDIPYEKQFHFGDGSSIASLEQLRDRIEHLSYQEFYHHVNAEKNDFASWIQHVLKDEKLASDLQKVSSIVETVEILNDYLHPRPAAKTDLQSQIEDQQEIHPPLDVEEVPTTTPAEQAEPARMEEPAEPAEPDEPAEPADMDAIKASIDSMPEEEQAPDAEAPANDSARKYVLSAEEKRMLVVKDFIFGMLFGLIIGLILGRIISIG